MQSTHYVIITLSGYLSMDTPYDNQEGDGGFFLVSKPKSKGEDRLPLQVIIACQYQTEI